MWVIKYLPLTKNNTLNTGRILYISREGAPLCVLVLSDLALSPGGGGGGHGREGQMAGGGVILGVGGQGEEFVTM